MRGVHCCVCNAFGRLHRCSFEECAAERAIPIYLIWIPRPRVKVYPACLQEGQVPHYHSCPVTLNFGTPLSLSKDTNHDKPSSEPVPPPTSSHASSCKTGHDDGHGTSAGFLCCFKWPMGFPLQHLSRSFCLTRSNIGWMSMPRVATPSALP